MFFEGLNILIWGLHRFFLKKPDLSIDTTVNPPTSRCWIPLRTLTYTITCKAYFLTETVQSFQRWKSQRSKIRRLSYIFSKDFSILGIAYGFLCQNPRFFLLITFDKGLRLLVSGFFLSGFLHSVSNFRCSSGFLQILNLLQNTLSIYKQSKKIRFKYKQS